DRAAAPRPVGARRAPGQDGRARRARSLRRRAGRDARGCRAEDPRGARARARVAARDRSGLRDEVPAARRRLPEARGDGRGRAARVTDARIAGARAMALSRPYEPDEQWFTL